MVQLLPAHRLAGRSSAQDSVLILGAGLAGLFTALKLAPLPVTVITPEPLGEGASSSWAQGGVAAAVGEGDTPEAHAADTISAGAGLVDEAVARLVTREGPRRVEDLLRYGAPFDRDLEGRLSLSREAAHGRSRVIRVKGDQAGKAIMAALIAAVRACPSIRVLEGWAASSLVLRDGEVVGIVRRPTGVLANGVVHSGTRRVHLARAVVLATGGAGQLYSVTTNPAAACGEGAAIAARAGAVIADAEFVQFHPTAINIGRDPAPLATEALRGDGAKLIDSRGGRFMADIHPSAELAPRDVVARAVHRQTASGGGAWLDCRDAVGARFPEHFPAVYEACRAAGIDPAREPIPVAPAAHYHMGGVLTDVRGRSSLDGLWACGEAASTGLHGANRLASNGLLEAAVFGARIAEDIQGLSPAWRGAALDASALDPGGPAQPGPKPARARRRLRETMTRCAGLERSQEGLTEALGVIEELASYCHADDSLGNMITGARLVVAAALNRRESRGGHWRADYPETDPAQARRTFITHEAALQTAAAHGVQPEDEFDHAYGEAVSL
jgi:L-aspartate oxidase